jgi:hypothetical protein
LSTALLICLAWLPGFFGVDQIEIWQPWPHVAVPQAWPADFMVTLQPFVSA